MTAPSPWQLDTGSYSGQFQLFCGVPEIIIKKKLVVEAALLLLLLLPPPPLLLPKPPLTHENSRYLGERGGWAVSYTHLTLPTTAEV